MKAWDLRKPCFSCAANKGVVVILFLFSKLITHNHYFGFIQIDVRVVVSDYGGHPRRSCMQTGWRWACLRTSLRHGCVHRALIHLYIHPNDMTYKTVLFNVAQQRDVSDGYIVSSVNITEGDIIGQSDIN